MESLDDCFGDLPVETVESVQDKNSFLHFCSCDSSLVFNVSTAIQGIVICVLSELIWEFLWIEVRVSLINLEFLG